MKVTDESNGGKPADALTALLEAAAEAGARRAIEALSHEQLDTLIDIKTDPLVTYRRYLNAIRAGELAAFKTGKRTVVKRSDRDAWLTREGARVPVKCAAEPVPDDFGDDEIGDILRANAERRAGRGRR